jgi:hypothetical protein
MHRRAAALVAMMAALVLSAAPAAAEPNPAFNRAVSGPVVGATFVDFLTSGCGLVHQTVDGTSTTAKGETGSFHLDMCPTFGVDSGSVEIGSFTLRDPRGSTLDGTVTGVYDTSTPPNIPFEFTLHAVTGTRCSATPEGRSPSPACGNSSPFPARSRELSWGRSVRSCLTAASCSRPVAGGTSPAGRGARDR